MTSLADIAREAGVSIKTVSGALHGSARMSEETRARIHEIAARLGYVVDIAARGTRQGWLPVVGMVADGLITSPFATEIMRVFDNALKREGTSVLVTNVHDARTLEAEILSLLRFKPRAIAYAAMYHKVVALPAMSAGRVAITINCRAEDGGVPAFVPAERQAALDITRLMLAGGRRRPIFLNLPGLLAGTLRADGFRAALAEAGGDPAGGDIRMATAGGRYHDAARSLVTQHLRDAFSGPAKPDAVLCGNDRVALEAYNALRRLGVGIGDDVAVGSFDNQVDIAARLDPPLTTMALPHQAMARAAAAIVLGQTKPEAPVTEFPFRLVRRASL